MKTWGVYLMGAITGAAVLWSVERTTPTATAAPAFRPPAAEGSTTVSTAVGSTEANRNDVLFVVETRPLTAEETDKLPERAKGRVQNHVTVSAYRLPRANTVDLKLYATRNATLDFAFDEWVAENEQKAMTAKQVHDLLETPLPKPK